MLARACRASWRTRAAVPSLWRRTYSVDAATAARVRDSVAGIYAQTLFPMNDKVLGPLEKDSEGTTIMPFVFLLGNHSSGKR